MFDFFNFIFQVLQKFALKNIKLKVENHIAAVMNNYYLISFIFVWFNISFLLLNIYLIYFFKLLQMRIFFRNLTFLQRNNVVC